MNEYQNELKTMNEKKTRQRINAIFNFLVTSLSVEIKEY